MNCPPAQKRLANAADELVQAALSETISANQLVGKEAALDMKKLLGATNRLVGQVGEAKESSDAKLNTVTQRLLNSETKVSVIETVVAGMDKARRIEWALDDVKSSKIPGDFSIQGFEHYRDEQMSEFLRAIL